MSSYDVNNDENVASYDASVNSAADVSVEEIGDYNPTYFKISDGVVFNVDDVFDSTLGDVSFTGYFDRQDNGFALSDDGLEESYNEKGQAVMDVIDVSANSFVKDAPMLSNIKLNSLSMSEAGERCSIKPMSYDDVIALYPDFHGSMSDGDYYFVNDPDLGSFVMDDSHWEIADVVADGEDRGLALHYKGAETYGGLIFPPEGVKSLNYMFMNSGLESPLPYSNFPKSANSMDYMYKDSPDMVGFAGREVSNFENTDFKGVIPAHIKSAEGAFDGCENAKILYSFLEDQSEMENLNGFARGCPNVECNLDIGRNLIGRCRTLAFAFYDSNYFSDEELNSLVASLPEEASTPSVDSNLTSDVLSDTSDNKWYMGPKPLIARDPSLIARTEDLANAVFDKVGQEHGNYETWTY